MRGDAADFLPRGDAPPGGRLDADCLAVLDDHARDVGVRLDRAAVRLDEFAKRLDDPARPTHHEGNADRFASDRWIKARRAIAEVLRLVPDSSIKRDTYGHVAFARASDRERYAAALRKAGLPEG